MELGTIEEVETIVDQIAHGQIPPPNKAQSLVIIRQMVRIAKQVESLTRENAQLRAVIAEQKETIEELTKENRIERNLRIGVESSFDCFNEEIGRLKATVDTCDELSRLAKIKRDEQSALIELLGEALRIGWSPYYVSGIDAKTLADEALAELAAWKERK